MSAFCIVMATPGLSTDLEMDGVTPAQTDQIKPLYVRHENSLLICVKGKELLRGDLV